ncbi:hypothetical protein [Nonomuraea sp. KM90]|uniref:hypothetical protein n=1 Tax=Nonomuraea sp. KM90 TaxID=3457428 RepID=UPI003FCCCC13
MTYRMKKLLVALAAVTLTGAGAAVAALPASAGATVQAGALFNGFAKNLDEDVALADAESAARLNALKHGFTECDVFESVVSQDPRTLVFFAVVTVRCVDAG